MFLFLTILFSPKCMISMTKVNSPFLNGAILHRNSNGVYISQLIRFARVCSHATDFSNMVIGIISFEKLFLNFVADGTNLFLNLMLV